MRTQMGHDEVPPIPDLKARILELRAVAGNAKLRAAKTARGRFGNGLEIESTDTVTEYGAPSAPVLRAMR